MTRITVTIPGERAYDVQISTGALDGLGAAVRSFDDNPCALVITDTEVGPRYLGRVKASLQHAGYRVPVVTVPSGETAKSLECAGEVWHAMADCDIDRSSLVVALGGGVVGDLAGFTASTFMRGVRIVQAPTTLLSMVDSSVGGKTAVNLESGKNLVGTFAQPIYVCADISALSTLPDREWACGLGEVVKSAVIDSEEFFSWLEKNQAALAERNLACAQEAAIRCVAFKARVVAADQHETSGIRECLNYGHTLAHAIETEAGYGVYSHGHAVAQGMRLAARLAAGLGYTSRAFVDRQDSLLDALGLPELVFHANPDRLLVLMKGDKKARAGHVRFVLPCSPGVWEARTLDDSVVHNYLAAWQRSL